MEVTAELKTKAKWVEKRLAEHYGERVWRPGVYDEDLVGALVATILSQHTSDINSGRAYQSLKQIYAGDWGAVAESPADEIAKAIRRGGLADVKAIRIKSLLSAIRERNGSLQLDRLHKMRDTAAMDFLTSFHGVGPKTAACILMFNLGRPVIAVDTHVHRVSLRIGLVPLKTSPERTQEMLLAEVGPSRAYSCHVHLIEHGRSICHSQRPKCSICPVSRRCNYFHEQQFAQ